MQLTVYFLFFRLRKIYHLISTAGQNQERRYANTDATLHAVLQSTEMLDGPSPRETKAKAQEPLRTVSCNLAHQNPEKPDSGREQRDYHETLNGVHPVTRSGQNLGGTRYETDQSEGESEAQADENEDGQCNVPAYPCSQRKRGGRAEKGAEQGVDMTAATIPFMKLAPYPPSSLPTFMLMANSNCARHLTPKPPLNRTESPRKPDFEIACPSHTVPGEANGDDESRENDEGKKNTAGVSHAMLAIASRVRSSPFDDMKHFHGQNRQNTGHDVQNDAAKKCSTKIAKQLNSHGSNLARLCAIGGNNSGVSAGLELGPSESSPIHQTLKKTPMISFNSRNKTHRIIRGKRNCNALEYSLKWYALERMMPAALVIDAGSSRCSCSSTPPGKDSVRCRERIDNDQVSLLKTFCHLMHYEWADCVFSSRRFYASNHYGGESGS